LDQQINCLTPQSVPPEQENQQAITGLVTTDLAAVAAAHLIGGGIRGADIIFGLVGKGGLELSGKQSC